MVNAKQSFMGHLLSYNMPEEILKADINLVPIHLHLFPFLHLLWGLISHVSYVGCRLGLRCSTPVERPGAKISLLWLCEGGKRGIVDLNWCGSWDQSLRMKGQSVAEVIKGDDPNGWDGLFISPKADKYRQKRDEQKTEFKSLKASSTLVEEKNLIYMAFLRHPTHFVGTDFIIFSFETEKDEFSFFSLGWFILRFIDWYYAHIYNSFRFLQWVQP